MAERLGAIAGWAVADAVAGSVRQEPSDTSIAEVTKANGGDVWVRLAGAKTDTPVRRVLQSVSVGDTVRVTISGGRATIIGNSTSPAVGSEVVDATVAPVSKQAEKNRQMALEAKIAANSAVSDAGIARAAASSAQTDAQIARDSADSAVADAATAKASAQVAQDAAGVARQEAEAASASAAQANVAANDALAQLGVVQDVTGTLAWVTEHGTYALTQDATVQDGKAYFVRTGSEPYTYVLVSDPRDADIGTYYELSIDEALSQYVSSHLALTDAGLYVTKDASGYRVLLANDGMSVVDPQGHTVAKYGEGTTFASDRDWYVGNAKAFVFYDASEGTLQIGGSDVTIGGKAPADLLTSLDVSVTQTATGADITVNGDTVSIANGQDGTDGKTWYTHIRYSASADGTGHVATPTASTVYIGTYTGTSSTAPSSKSSYKWSKYVGQDGTDGHSPEITTSHSGTTTTIYADGTSIGTVEDGADGSTPSITATKSGGTTTIKVDGTTIATVDDGEDGTTPTVTTRKNSDGSTTVVINGSDSATIENGTDGTSYYTYVRYSANADGSGMVASPTSATKYIGVYSGTSASVPAYTSFKWSKYVGEDGSDAAPLTVTATSTEYQLSTSGTETPTGEWSATPLAPTQTQFLWTKTTLTFSDGTTATSYSVGGLAGAKGDKGDQGDTGPEGIVSVTPDAIDWEASTATLRATLWVNGEDVQPTAWSWTKNLDSTVLGTGQTLEVTDLDATYRCTVTW